MSPDSPIPPIPQGDIDDAGEWTFMPSIGVDPQDNVAICYSRSSASRFVEMWYAAQSATATGWEKKELVVASTAAYVTDTDDEERWGDYSAVAIDPVNGSFWCCHEWVSSADADYWRTYWANFDL